MRLQKQLSRKVGDKKYTKYVVIIPSKIVEESGIKEGDELNARLKEGKIILEKIIKSKRNKK